MDAEEGREGRTGSQAVDRAVRILRIFEHAEELGITEIAKQVDLRIPTAHRIVAALRRGGLIEQDQRTERYRLGPVVVALGRRAAATAGIDLLVPHLEAVAGETGESVNLGVRDGAAVLVLAGVASRHPLRFDQEPGSRVPIHTSAMGKAILASEPDLAETVAELELAGLARPTERTLTGDELLADLEATRERGWSLNDEERNPGVRAVGAPLRRSDGRAWAAVAVQGPTARIDDDALAAYGHLVVAAAAAMEAALGDRITGSLR